MPSVSENLADADVELPRDFSSSSVWHISSVSLDLIASLSL